jgi:hypothetical protein
VSRCENISSHKGCGSRKRGAVNRFRTLATDSTTPYSSKLNSPTGYCTVLTVSYRLISLEVVTYILALNIFSHTV